MGQKYNLASIFDPLACIGNTDGRIGNLQQALAAQIIRLNTDSEFPPTSLLIFFKGGGTCKIWSSTGMPVPVFK